MNTHCLFKAMLSTLFIGFITILHASENPSQENTAAKEQANALTQKAVLKNMRKVADWMLANPTGNPLNTWEYGPFYEGVMMLYKVSKDKKYYDATLKMGNTVTGNHLHSRTMPTQ